MNNVFIAGPTHYSKVTYFNQHKANINNDVNFLCDFSDECYTIAKTLAMLGINTTYYSVFGENDLSLQLVNELTKAGCEVKTSYDKNLPATKFIIADENCSTQTTYVDNLYNKYPQITDEHFLDYYQFDIGYLINVNTQFIRSIIQNNTQTRWIVGKYIPGLDVLNQLEGIILDYFDACNITHENSFPILAQDLIKKGAKWVIITDRGKGAWFISDYLEEYIKPDYTATNNYFVGTHEMFCATLLANLANGVDLFSAINNAVNNAARKLDDYNLSINFERRK